MMDACSVSKVAVIGFGTMGSGIAERFAECGYEVVATDAARQQLEAGLALIERNQQTLIEAGLLEADQADESKQRLRTTSSLAEAVNQAQLVIEAVPENMDLKLETFGELDKLCDAGAILASNTSGLSITKIATAVADPERAAGYHWWNPPHIMPLVEVIKGERTSDETVATLVAIAKRLGKRPIVVQRDVPGFVGNRLQFAVFREALHLLTEGIATAEDIDTAMTAGPGLRYGLLGPLRTADLGGLDVFHAISGYLFRELSAADGPPALLSELVEKGKLGAKTGEGFYDFSDQSLPEIAAERDRVLLGFLKALEEKEASDAD